jgi:hypothetical protein
MTIILEQVEHTLVGRIYVDGRITTAYVVPLETNKHLFTEEQLTLINKQTF